MRGPEPLPEFMAAASSAGANDGFSVGRDGVGLLACSDGTTTLIGRATEGHRLFMLLGCGRHTRYCTPHCINSVEDLTCTYCTPDEELRRMGRARPSSYERTFWDEMEGRGLGWRLCPEVVQPWWRGPIDFVERSSGICFQIDGEHHFLKNMYGTPKAVFVGRDAANCVAALTSGCTVVRLHYIDVLSGAGPSRAAEILRGAEAGPRRPCVMLSPAFNLSAEPPTKLIPQQARLFDVILKTKNINMYSNHQKWSFIEM